MPTRYHLLPLRRYSNQLFGPVFHIGDRSKWTFTLNVASPVPTGASISVVVEVGPTGEVLTFSTFADFGTKTATGSFELETDSTLVIDPINNRYMRARITSIQQGNTSPSFISASLDAEAPFFDVKSTDHLALCTKELLDSNNRERYLTKAEEDVVNFLIFDSMWGALDIDLSIPEASFSIRQEIVRQADHIRIREGWSRQAPATRLALTYQLGPRAPLFCNSLRQFRPQRANAYYGR